MNTVVIKRWGPLASAVCLALVAAYAVVWTDRVGCGQTALLACWVAAFGNRLADILWLGWVDKYQTLIGGILAIVAASTVVFNSMWERQARRKDDAEKRAAAFTSQLTAISTSFRHAAIMFISAADPSEGKRAVEQLEARINEISSDAPLLSASLLLLVGRARIYIDVGTAGVSAAEKNRIKKCIDALLECGHFYLKDAERFSIGGPEHVPIFLGQSTRGVLNWDVIDEQTKKYILGYVSFLTE